MMIRVEVYKKNELSVRQIFGWKDFLSMFGTEVRAITAVFFSDTFASHNILQKTNTPYFNVLMTI